MILFTPRKANNHSKFINIIHRKASYRMLFWTIHLWHSSNFQQKVWCINNCWSSWWSVANGVTKDLLTAGRLGWQQQKLTRRNTQHIYVIMAGIYLQSSYWSYHSDSTTTGRHQAVTRHLKLSHSHYHNNVANLRTHILRNAKQLSIWQSTFPPDLPNKLSKTRLQEVAWWNFMQHS